MPRGTHENSLRNLKPARPGEVRNPAGRKTAGATIKEHLNALAERNLTAKQLRTIARSDREPWTRRAAAERILRTLETGDLADMEGLLNGSVSLAELRETGVNTEVIKKVRTKVRTLDDGTTETEREVELFDRAGIDFDRVLDRTEGKPRQTLEVEGTGIAPQVLVMRHGSRPALPELPSRN